MQSVLDLVPLNKVDREVVKSGAWSNPATWSGGRLPDAGQNVYVPEGKALMVDIASGDSLGTVRVDGNIEFASSKNVKIKLDTLVVTETGTFTIGSESKPVPGTNKVEIIIAKNGPINRKWDPANISRGVILEGKTKIYGAVKSAFHTLSVKPGKGATQIQLSSAPTGWGVGDVIAITAGQFYERKYNQKGFSTEDELRTIKAISGNTVTLGSVNDSSAAGPLDFNHVPAIPKMPVYAANMTRNITFSSEGGSSIPANQRGHFMVMHTPDVVIKGAGFYYFGRTDKSIPIDDYQLDGRDRRIKKSGQWVPSSSNNPRGRYSVHFHHTGVSDINIPPVICSGNAVFDSPGWGFVTHASHVIMENNASYNVYGSHYVSEDGNELGAFRRNIAIRSQGSTRPVTGGEFNHDVGHTGHGFWLESRNMALEDNVVSGVKHSGIMYFQRNMGASRAELMIPKGHLIMPYKDIVKNLPEIYYADIPITKDKNNTVLASGLALMVVKTGRTQGHDVRNMIESLKGYSLREGITLTYTEKYTLRDVHLLAGPSHVKSRIGVSIAKRTRDIVLVDSEIAGFPHPIATGGVVRKELDPTDAVFVNFLVDGKPVNLAADIHKPRYSNESNYNPALQKAMNLSDTNNTSVLKMTPSKNTPSDLPNKYTFYIEGTKTDSLGDTAFKSRWELPSIDTMIKNGYFTSKDGKPTIVLEDYYTDRLTGESRTFKTVFKFVRGNRKMGTNLGVLDYY